MTNKVDDLEAVRTIVETLSNFDADTQERVLRWSREKLGLKNVAPPSGPPPLSSKPPIPPASKDEGPAHHRGGSSNIKTFITTKAPSNNQEFVATVAYFYRFEAPESLRKNSITADDLQEACRLSDRTRLVKPSQALVHAYHAGLLDRAEPGAYTISTVGENLVAMALPADSATKRGNTPARRKPSKKSDKKSSKTDKKKLKGS